MTAQLIIHVCAIGFTAEKFLVAQAAHQRDRGYRVGFIFSPGPEAARLRDAGFEVHELHVPRTVSPRADGRAVREMAALFDRLQPALVHTHTSKGGFIGRLAARAARVPRVVHTVHGFPFAEGMSPARYWTFVAMERLAARLTDVMFSQSSADVHTARAYRILPRDRQVRHIGNGIDLARFDPVRHAAARDTTRAALGLVHGEVALLTIGRINREKGYYELIDALAGLGKPVHLLCAGFDEGHQAVLQARAHAAGLGPRVHWLGLREDVPQLMAAADGFVLASHREGVPRSLIEAQAMGLPCVATDIRGCNEVVVARETGWLVPSRDASALRAALDEMLSDPDRASRLATAGQTRARSTFSEHAVCERIWAGYQSILGRPGHAAPRVSSQGGAR